jgi:hypothetical protein
MNKSNGSSEGLVTIQNFVDGGFVDPAKGLWLDNIEPATGKVSRNKFLYLIFRIFLTVGRGMTMRKFNF